MAGSKKIEYICSYCGQKKTRSELQGRPMPGKCPRQQGDKPHSWRKNRTINWKAGSVRENL